MMSKNGSKTLRNMNIWLIAIFLLLMNIVSFSTAQQNTTRSDKRRASEAADSFLMRYRETLDFGKVFDEMSASIATSGLRNSKFFEQFQVDPMLVRQLDDETLMQAYKTMMNVYYLGMLYNILNQRDDDDEAKLPDDIVTLLKESKFANLTTEDSADSKPIINTRQDFEDYVELNNRLATLYKKHLPQKPFDLPACKNKFEGLEKQRANDSVTFNGYENFGIAKGKPVYIAQRGIFSLVMVEEAGKIKVLTLGIGN